MQLLLGGSNLSPADACYMGSSDHPTKSAGGAKLRPRLSCGEAEKSIPSALQGWALQALQLACPCRYGVGGGEPKGSVLPSWGSAP